MMTRAETLERTVESAEVNMAALTHRTARAASRAETESQRLETLLRAKNESGEVALPAGSPEEPRSDA